MLRLSEYFVFTGIVAVALALVCYVLAFASVRVARARALAAEGAGGEGEIDFADAPRGVAGFATLTTWMAVALLTVALVFRSFATGHGPFANMYEFSVAFAWGALVVHGYFLMRYRQWVTGIIVALVALALLLYATTNSAEAAPLVPALQNNLLLTVHVAVAVIAYGAFAVAFAAALLYLLQSTRGDRWYLPKRELLDEVSYRATLVGFPFMTLTIVLGAVWADVAWGRYWSWDPKETASLVTWIVCGSYLHARSARGWRGERAAILLILVFGATLFTYFGNYFLGGLHSYGK